MCFERALASSADATISLQTQPKLVSTPCFPPPRLHTPVRPGTAPGYGSLHKASRPVPRPTSRPLPVHSMAWCPRMFVCSHQRMAKSAEASLGSSRRLWARLCLILSSMCMYGGSLPPGYGTIPKFITVVHSHPLPCVPSSSSSSSSPCSSSSSNQKRQPLCLLARLEQGLVLLLGLDEGLLEGVGV